MFDTQIPGVPYVIDGNEWNQDVTEESVKAYGRGQVTPLFGKGFVDYRSVIGNIALKAEEIPVVGQTVSDLIEILSGVEDGNLNDVGTWVNDIKNKLYNALDDIADLVSDMATKASTAVVNAVSDFVQSLVNAILRAIRGIPVVGGSLADIISDLGGLNRTVENTNVVVEAATAVTNTYYTPMWHSMDNGDVTFPELFTQVRGHLAGVTGPQSAGTAHTHTFGSAYMDMSGAYEVAAGWSRGSYLRSMYSGIRDTVKFNAAWLATTGGSDVYLAVYANSEGNLFKKIFQTEVSSYIPTGNIAQVTVPIPAGLITEQGREYLIELRNGGSKGFWLDCLVTDFPVFGWYRSGGDYGIMDATTAKNAYAPWFGLFTDSPQKNEAVYTDNFNRKKIGELWWLESNGAAQKLYISGERLSYNGLTDGSQWGVYVKPVGTSCYTEATISGTTSQPVWLGASVEPNNTSGVYAQITSTGSKVTFFPLYASGGTDVITSSVGGDGRWAVAYHLDTKTMYLYKDGNVVGTYVDTANQFNPEGFHGLGVVGLTRSSWVNSGTIDDFKVQEFIL